MPLNTHPLRHQLSRRDSVGNARSWSKRIPHSISIHGGGGGGGGGALTKTSVMAVVDSSPEAKIAMLWALSNLCNNLDTLILLHVIHTTASRTRGGGGGGEGEEEEEEEGGRWRWRSRSSSASSSSHLTNSLRSLCKARRPEVDVQTVVIQSEKMAASIVKQANKLQASVLVLGQRRPSLLHRFLRKKEDELLQYCVDHAECLSLGVRKQSSSIGGYLINSKWHKNFWLLA